MGHPSIAPISYTQLWTGPRVRLSLEERRMKCREPRRLHRKSGLVGIEPKKRVPSTLHLPPASEFAQKRDLGHPLKVSKLQFVFRQRSHGPAGPPKVMKNGSCSTTTLPGSTALPFVISTGAQRSGEICGSAALSWKCFSREHTRISCFAPDGGHI